jgi:hypothetical protein
MPGLVPGIHVFLPLPLRKSKTWMAGHRRAEATPSFGRLRPAMTLFGCVHAKTSNQILFGDDFAEPGVIGNEFLDEFMHAVLEDIVHVAVFEAIADATGMAL